ncbi:hypothetical protein B0H13DRAFT_2670614 [Mycena leptocephala]|nr:hypothetical protein B0H13DRAFT_2670614 [Mycena leptocephala]
MCKIKQTSLTQRRAVHVPPRIRTLAIDAEGLAVRGAPPARGKAVYWAVEALSVRVRAWGQTKTQVQEGGPSLGDTGARGVGREAIFVLGVRKRPIAVAFVSLHAALRLPALPRHALNVYHIEVACSRSLCRTTSSCSESKSISHQIVAAARACAASSPARSGSVLTTTLLLLLALSRSGGGWTNGRPLSAAACFHVLPPSVEDVGMWQEAQRQRVLAQHKLFAERASCHCPAPSWHGPAADSRFTRGLAGGRRARQRACMRRRLGCGGGGGSVDVEAVV